MCSFVTRMSQIWRKIISESIYTDTNICQIQFSMTCTENRLETCCIALEKEVIWLYFYISSSKRKQDVSHPWRKKTSSNIVASSSSSVCVLRQAHCGCWCTKTRPKHNVTRWNVFLWAVFKSITKKHSWHFTFHNGSLIMPYPTGIWFIQCISLFRTRCAWFKAKQKK